MDVSRRNFNFGFVGALLASLIPGRVSEASPAPPATDRDKALARSSNYIARGRVASQPTLKTYPKAEGGTGTRASFRLAVEGVGVTQFLPIVVWGSLARKACRELWPGQKIMLVGSTIADNSNGEGGYHIVLSGWEVS